MRLRKTINPPQRYESESEESPVEKQRLPQIAPAGKTQCRIDFDPSLPPAAFPTLDQPLPASQVPHAFSTPHNGALATTFNSLEASSDQVNSVNQGLFANVPFESLDNFVASNGPQNPQYRRNMALLGQEESTELEISSDEEEKEEENDEGHVFINDDEVAYHEENYVPEDPQWYHLPLSLQIEIAENMLEIHSLPKIGILLGLNQCDIEQLARELHQQNEGIELENSVLGDIREKQLRALMYLDNSDLKKHPVPAQLVMSRKSFVRCQRVVQKKSKMRYLLCQARDLLITRRFLSRRGLPTTYAGEWNNDFVASPSTSNTIGSLETFEWKTNTMPMKTQASTTEDDESGPKPPPGFSTELQLEIQYARSSTLQDQKSAHTSRRGRNVVSRPVTQRRLNKSVTQMALPRHGLIRLKIGQKNASRILAWQTAAPPGRHTENDVVTNSLRQTSVVRELNSDDTIEQSPSTIYGSVPSKGQSPLPMRRKLAFWTAENHHIQPSRFSLPLDSGSYENSNRIHRGLSTAERASRVQLYPPSSDGVIASNIRETQATRSDASNGILHSSGMQPQISNSAYDQYPCVPVEGLKSTTLQSASSIASTDQILSSQGTDVSRIRGSHAYSGVKPNSTQNRIIAEMAESTKTQRKQETVGMDNSYFGFEDPGDTQRSSHITEITQCNQGFSSLQQSGQQSANRSDGAMTGLITTVTSGMNRVVADSSCPEYELNNSKEQQEGENTRTGSCHLTISGGAAEMSPEKEKTRQTEDKKKATGKKRIASLELPASQSKRGRRSGQYASRRVRRDHDSTINENDK